MQRRQFLAGGTALLTAALAGCAHPAVVLDMDEATAEDVASQTSTTADPDSPEYDVVTDAVANGSATWTGRRDLFDADEHVRVNDTVYDVTETRVASGEVTVYEVRVDVDPEDATPELGEIAYDDLPDVDRERLDVVVRDDPPDGEGYDVGVRYGTAEEVGDDSVFVPDPQYDVLVHDGERYRVDVVSRTADEATYRYDVSVVAASVEAYADQLRDEYLFTLAGLSEAEREVVTEATEGGYFEDTDAFRSVVDRIRDHDGFDVTDAYGTWLLAYDGTDYLAYVEW